MSHVKLDAESCAGCGICEAVCSLSHEAVVSPRFARLRIIDHYLEGHRIEGHTCQQCTIAKCLDACPVEAWHVDEKTSANIIDTEKCLGCEACMLACSQYPNTLVFYDDAKKVCFKCDLCGGDPLCVKFCPQGALSLSKN
ncbi:4Fe-4S dicluster domain-containing protein [Chloroflexota bacterium]